MSAEEICQLVQRINQAWRTGHPEQLEEFFHPDMVITGPGYQVMGRGRTACIDSYRQFAATATIHEYSESNFKTEVWGDTAVCTYTWTIDYETAGRRSRETGTDQFVFGRQASQWLALWRCVNLGPVKPT